MAEVQIDVDAMPGIAEDVQWITLEDDEGNVLEDDDGKPLGYWAST